MTFCYDDYLERQRSHEEGLASERDSYLEGLREEISSQLDDGDEIDAGGYTMTKAEIIGQELTPEDCQLIADLHTLGPARILNITNVLIERCDEIMEAWLDKHISIIAEIREKADAEYAAEIRAELDDAA